MNPTFHTNKHPIDHPHLSSQNASKAAHAQATALSAQSSAVNKVKIPPSSQRAARAAHPLAARFASERLDCVQHPSTTNCTIYRQEYAGPSQRASLTALATATRTTRALIPSKTVLSSPKKNATQAFAPHECWWQRRGCADSLSGPGWRGVGTMPCSLFRQHHET